MERQGVPRSVATKLKAAALRLDGYNHGDNRRQEVDAAGVRV